MQKRTTKSQKEQIDIDIKENFYLQKRLFKPQKKNVDMNGKFS